MSISDKLNQIRLSKKQIAQAIEAHGVNMQGITFANYAAKIGSIQAQTPSNGNGQMIPTVNGQIMDFKMILPEGMSRIYAQQFWYNTSTEVVLPSTLLHIEIGAFSNSKSKRVVIPASVLTIGGGAFSNMSELEYLEFKGNPTLGSGMFATATKLKTVVLHPSQKLIQINMFNSSGLENINLSEIERIEDNGLTSTKLQQAILPKCNYLGASVLYGCSELEYVSIGGLIEFTQSQSITANPKLKVLVLANCRFMGRVSASTNPMLRYIEITTNGSSPVLSHDCFASCPKIEFVVLRSPTKFTVVQYSGGQDPFSQANLNVLKIYVNDALLSAYKADTSWTKYWNNFYPISALPISNPQDLVDITPPTLTNYTITVLEDNSAIVSINTDAAIVELKNPNSQVINLSKSGNIYSATIPMIVEGEYSLFLQDENFNRMTHKKTVYSFGGIDPIISLFSGGINGLYINAQNTETMRQDAAGTQAVNGISQTIGRVLDLSGNNNHMIISNASQQPKLELDARNKNYLNFDGVDDTFMIALNKAFTSGSAKTIIFSADGSLTGTFTSALYLLTSNSLTVGWAYQLHGNTTTMAWGLGSSAGGGVVTGGTMQVGSNAKRFIAGMRLNTADAKYKARFYGLDNTVKQVEQEIAKNAWSDPITHVATAYNRVRGFYRMLVIERELTDAEMAMVYDKFAKGLGGTYEP